MKPFLLALLTFISFYSYSQVPQKINYQAVARNANGTILPNQYISVELSVRDGSPSATIVYQEIDTATTNQFGLFTVAIGAGQVQVGTNLTAINWSTGNKYLQVGFNQTGGTSNFTVMGTTELLSVPYALYAANSGGGGNSGWSDYAVYTEEVSSGNNALTQLSDTTWVSRQLNYTENQLGSSISRNGNNITLLPGTYHVSASAELGVTIASLGGGATIFDGIANNLIRLWNSTTDSTVVKGLTQTIFIEFTENAGENQIRQSNFTTMEGIFTISTTSTIALQQYVQYENLISGISFNVDAGKPVSQVIYQSNNIPLNGLGNEVYARILIQKIN